MQIPNSSEANHIEIRKSDAPTTEKIDIGGGQKAEINYQEGTLKVGNLTYRVNYGGNPLSEDIKKNVMTIVKAALAQVGSNLNPESLGSLKINKEHITYKKSEVQTPNNKQITDVQVKWDNETLKSIQHVFNKVFSSSPKNDRDNFEEDFNKEESPQNYPNLSQKNTPNQPTTSKSSTTSKKQIELSKDESTQENFDFPITNEHTPTEENLFKFNVATESTEKDEFDRHAEGFAKFKEVKTETDDTGDIKTNSLPPARTDDDHNESFQNLKNKSEKKSSSYRKVENSKTEKQEQKHSKVVSSKESKQNTIAKSQLKMANPSQHRPNKITPKELKEIATALLGENIDHVKLNNIISEYQGNASSACTLNHKKWMDVKTLKDFFERLQKLDKLYFEGDVFSIKKSQHDLKELVIGTDDWEFKLQNEILKIVKPNNNKPTVIILALDKHFTTVYVDPIKKTVEYYDSMADYNAETNIEEQLEDLASTLGKDYKFVNKTIGTVDDKLQKDSYTCGTWASYFIEKRLNDPNFNPNAIPRDTKENMLYDYRLNDIHGKNIASLYKNK